MSIQQDLIAACSTFESFDELRRHFKYEELDDRWITGGQSGGDWRCNPADRSVDAEPEPNVELLHCLLETVCPSLTFIQYRELMKVEGLFTYASYESYEYYGNYTAYKVRTLSLEKLYEVLRGFL